jgi:hypothetical protein|tara:strand:- start:219 stop:434 length:216 start_codon:yes stop_codon:yes gene_type:complete
MKTTVIRVQEVKTEIDVIYFNIRLFNHDDYVATLRNGDTVKIRATEPETYVIFDDGKLRFNRPVKIVDDGR